MKRATAHEAGDRETVVFDPHHTVHTAAQEPRMEAPEAQEAQDAQVAQVVVTGTDALRRLSP